MRHLLALSVLCTMLAACATSATPRTFTLEKGQSVAASPGVTLTLDSVEDSRCPPGVQCVWAGRLTGHFVIRRDGGASESFTLSPGAPGAAPAALGGRRILLDESSLPAPAAPGAVAHHRITLTVLPPSTSPATP